MCIDINTFCCNWQHGRPSCQADVVSSKIRKEWWLCQEYNWSCMCCFLSEMNYKTFYQFYTLVKICLFIDFLKNNLVRYSTAVLTLAANLQTCPGEWVLFSAQHPLLVKLTCSLYLSCYLISLLSLCIFSRVIQFLFQKYAHDIWDSCCGCMWLWNLINVSSWHC